jgi:hypothetical protein
MRCSDLCECRCHSGENEKPCDHGDFFHAVEFLVGRMRLVITRSDVSTRSEV